jgi:hypothetical protein
MKMIFICFGFIALTSCAAMPVILKDIEEGGEAILDYEIEKEEMKRSTEVKTQATSTKKTTVSS